MEKIQKNFISIGEMSKMTGVNAKSLRYYEKIGVLPPAYIDPDNAYRYYTYSQISLIYAIQFYISLDIPLSEILNFVDKESGAINYKAQITYGAEVAKKKMQQLEKDIQGTAFLIRELDRTDRIRAADEAVMESFPEKTCWVQEIAGKLTEELYYGTLKQTWAEIKNAGISFGSEKGILYMSGKSYVFTEVRIVDDVFRNIIRIPAQSYKSIKTRFDDFDIENFADGIPSVVILSELFVSDYNYKERLYEVRWSVVKEY